MSYHHQLRQLLELDTLPSISDPSLRTAMKATFLPATAPQTTEAPQFIAIGGGPGAGKSYFYEYLKQQKHMPAVHVVHDPDLIMQALPEYQTAYKLDPSLAFADWELPARQLSHDILYEALLTRQPIVYLRSLALPNSLECLRLVKQLGYTLTIHLLLCEINIALSRAQLRQASLARYLPEAVIIERHQAVMQQIPALKLLADDYRQYDNSLHGIQPREI